MKSNNNDRQKLAITLSLKFEEMAASFDAMSKSLADFKASLQLIEDIAKRQELEDKVERGEPLWGVSKIWPISMADMQTSENQLSGPKMWMSPTIHLPSHPTDAPQTLAELEAYLIDKFGWRHVASYMTVDSSDNDGISRVWQWVLKPSRFDKDHGWSNYGIEALSDFIGHVALPENIDWKDCLFTRTTNETSE